MKIAFLGSKTLGLRLLKCLHRVSPDCTWRIIHAPDANDPRNCLQSFSEFTLINNLAFSVAPSSKAAYEDIVAFQPDIIFASGWYWLIDAAVLKIPKLGVLGVHTSLLPRYRGGSPLVWSIINGDPETGATVFKLSTGMDDGPILCQACVQVSNNDAIGEILTRIETELEAVLPPKWTDFLQGRVDLKIQDPAKATYCGQRTAEDGRIKWDLPAKTIHDFVRAQSPPYPGAFSFLDGHKIIFLKTRIDERIYHGTPGQVLSRNQESAVIGCGRSTALRVEQISINGSPQSVGAVLRSVKARLSW